MSQMSQMKDLVAKGVTAFHRTLYRTSGGKVGGKGFGMPVVELHTTGRKTGKRRSTMLTTPIHDNQRVVLVASYGGDDRHPTWFLNARDNPEVELTIHGETKPMTARVASPEEKAGLWPEVTSSYKGYAQYQTRTDRDIPLVILEPR